MAEGGHYPNPTASIKNVEGQDDDEKMTQFGLADSMPSVLPVQMSISNHGDVYDLEKDKIDVLGDINHVIKIDEIADNLFKYLSIEELNNSRLVCKLWDEKICEVLIKSWSELRMIELFQVEKFNEFQNAMKKAQVKRIFSQFYSRLDKFLTYGQQFFEQHQPKLLKVNLFRGEPPGVNFDDEVPTRIDDLLTLLHWSSGSLKELHINGVPGCNIFIFPIRNDGQDLVDFDLPYLEKITIDLQDWNNEDQVDIMMYKLFSGIVKKAPNLKSLKLYKAPATESCNFVKNLKSNEFLSKLQELAIFYGDSLDCDDDVNYEDGTQRTGPMDLIEMQENGLKNLKSFHLKLNFYNYKKAKLGRDFDLISKFLQGQSAEIQSLGLNIGIDNEPEIDNGFKINLPIFPKIGKLYLGNEVEIAEFMEDTFYFPFGMMDLSNQFPVLHEIHLNLRFAQNLQDSTWNLMFTGSSETVQIFRLSICDSDEDYDENPQPSYLPLENLFPNVKKFEVDDNFQFIGGGKYPWENSLKILSIGIYFLRELDFNIFIPFKELERIELTNPRKNWRKAPNIQGEEFDMGSFEKLRIKSLKIHHFLLTAEDVEQIREKCIFEYSPEKPEFENSYCPSDDDADDD